MATYQELFDLAEQNTHIDRISVAVLIAANAIQNEDTATANHANRVAWAKKAYADPKGQAKTFLHVILSANKDATVSTITGASDDAIQNNVNAAIDVVAGI